MTDQAQSPSQADPIDNIRKAIDADEGLRSKRKMLVVISLLLIGMSVTGATITEVNTLIFKVTFKNQAGLSYLLVVAVFFLSLRYYSYAKPYQDQLLGFWSSKMLKNDHFAWTDHESGPPDYDVSGWVYDPAPKGYMSDVDAYAQHENPEIFYKSHAYKPGLFPAFTYSWTDGYQDLADTIYLWHNKKMPWWACLIVMRYEIQYQGASWLTHRENLDIISPYLLASTAVVSFVYAHSF